VRPPCIYWCAGRPVSWSSVRQLVPPRVLETVRWLGRRALDQLDRLSPNNCLSHRVLRELASLQGGAANRAGAVALGTAALALQINPNGQDRLTVKTIERRVAPLGPVGCMRGLGGAEARHPGLTYS
jgi:hypothetical protein